MHHHARRYRHFTVLVSCCLPLICKALIRIITAALSFRCPSLFTYACMFPPRPIKALGHCLNLLQHLLEHRLILEKDHLARDPLKCLLRHIEPLVDKQQQRGTIGSTYLFYLSPQILWMPEAYQLNHNFPVFILIVGQNKVRDHHRIFEKKHFTFTSESPVPAFASHL